MILTLIVDFDKRAALDVGNARTAEDFVELTTEDAHRSAHSCRSLETWYESALCHHVAHLASTKDLVPHAMGCCILGCGTHCL